MRRLDETKYDRVSRKMTGLRSADIRNEDMSRGLASPGVTWTHPHCGEGVCVHEVEEETDGE